MSIFRTKVLMATDASDEAALAARTATDIADNTASILLDRRLLHAGNLFWGGHAKKAAS
jgi:hypothetical protein